MPTLNGLFCDRLTGNAGVNGVIGNRIFPTLPTQDDLINYAVYYCTDGGGDAVLGGRSRLQKFTYRVDVYAQTDDEAEAILNAIIVAVAGDPANSVACWTDDANGVQGCFAVADRDMQVQNSANELRVPGQSFEVHYAR